MYIEFQLPTGAGVLGPQYVNWEIIKKLDEWAERYGVKYTKKNVKYTLRVTFEDNSMYSVFALTWNPGQDQKNLFNYRLIETLQFDRY